MKHPEKKEKKHIAPNRQENDLASLPEMSPPPVQMKASEGSDPQSINQRPLGGLPFQMKPDQEAPQNEAQAGKEAQGPQSIDQMMEEKSPVPVSGQSMAFDMQLGANQTLYHEGQNRVHTGDSGVNVHVAIRTWGFSVRFSPGLTVTHDPGKWLPNVDVNLTGYSWNFASQKMEATWSARRIVNWVGDPGEKIHTVMRENVLSKLPSQMFEKGYDPFQDENLIPAMENIFDSASSPDLEMPENSHARMSAGFTLDEDLTTNAGGYDITIPAGTRLKLSANAGGGLPENLADTSIDSLAIDFSGGDANVQFKILGENISALNIRRVTFRNGGDVSFDYGLVTESLASIGKLFLMLGQLRTGRDLGVRDLDSRHEGIRKIIDEKLDENVEPMVKELILENKNLLPGFDLSKILGVG